MLDRDRRPGAPDPLGDEIRKMCQFHSRHIILMLWFVLAGIDRAAGGDDVTADRVRQLVDQLGAPSVSLRGEAERALRDLGPQVLPFLPDPDRVASAASQEALLRLREVLERQQAEATATASHVSLSGRFTLREIVASITEQTGNPIDLSNVTDEVRDMPLDIDWLHATFWETIRHLESQTGHHAQPDTEGRSLRFLARSGGTHASWIVDSGAFRFEAQSFSRRPDFTDESREILRMEFNLLAEPRLRPLFIRMNHADFQLLATERPLKPLNAEAKLERPADRGTATSLMIDFVTPKGGDVKTVDLAGKLTVELAAGEENFVFRNLDSSERVARRRGGVTVTMDRARFSPAVDSPSLSCRVDVRVAYDAGGPAFESHRTWVFHNEAFLQTADGARRWSPSDFDTVAEGEAAVRLSYGFREVAMAVEDLEFAYTAPILVVRVPVDFEILGLLERSKEVD